ncbi:PIR Superfamily Protein [Plasmodium ovale curtisi]|uniref:PIR Superfamily Protein n=1 Tax=Plasmodium ovale curtisi TaxID=864141 RepID=A0A1A8WUH7_PLAOA|nr:PIR Superfamily Protein [Plasmodium ovale curtisi]SBS98940.1 PIR Superfamily Protein [Plasmodium ovale curtisi]
MIYGLLEGENRDSGDKHVWNNMSYSNSVIKIRQFLDNFYSIRDKLGGVDKIKTERDRCLVFNKNMYEYKKDILVLISGIRDDKKMDYLEHQECIARENFLIPSAIPHSEDVVAVEIRRKEV